MNIAAPAFVAAPGIADADAVIARELPAARGGDREAFGRIVLVCQNTITAVALAVTRDVQASEDIAQQAFLDAWRQLRELRSADSFLPWLRQIARNLARDHLRMQRHRPLDGEGAELAIALAADPGPEPPQCLEDDARAAAAAELLAAMPAESRETLLLFYREGQSSQQVARLLGLTDAAVRKRLSRARQALREDLLARFGEFAADSAPGVGFASAVATALSIASAPAAAAHGLLTGGLISGGKAVAGTLGKGAASALGTIVFGALVAVASILYRLRKQLREALDEQERRALRRSAVVNVAATLAFMLAMPLTMLTDGWVAPMAAFLGFMAVVLYQSLVMQPRAMARRHAFEAQRDPAGAARRRRSEGLKCRLGAGLGTVLGLGSMIAALILSGRMVF